jgi:transposase
MAHAQETISAVRAAYVHERLPLKAAASKHGVSYATARTWKSKAGAAGDDWDKAHARHPAALAT